VSVKGEHPDLRPRLVVDNKAGEANYGVACRRSSRLDAGVCRPAHEIADRLADREAMPDRLPLHDLPGVWIDLDLDRAVGTMPIRRADALAALQARRLLAFDAAADDLGVVASFIEVGGRFFECEGTLGAFAVPARELFERFGI
jgi:hypothetical protein